MGNSFFGTTVSEVEVLDDSVFVTTPLPPLLELEVVFDTANFEFHVKYNGGEMPPYNVQTDNYWFANVSFWGDMRVQYAGFPYLGMIMIIYIFI